MKISKQKVVNTLDDLIRYAERNTCLHETTHRGGVIWEICDECGMKWADDEGGKPDNAHDLPNEIEAAHSLLAEIEKGGAA